MPESYGVTSQVFPADNLFAGDFPAVEMPATVVTGSGVLTRGTVLGKITTGGKLAPYASGNADGSETPFAILSRDIDATSNDVVVSAYRTGVFNENALTGFDEAGRAALETRLVFVKKLS